VFKLFGGPRVETIDVELVQAKLTEPAKPYVLDVRTLAEFRQGHISGAKHIPLNELHHRLGEVPSDKEIVTVCHSGSRSRVAANVLMANGYLVKNMKGGMNAWKGPVKR